MITLKEALKLSKDEIKSLKDEIKEKSAAYPELNGYIALDEMGDGVPVAIKDNISVKGWAMSAGSKMLQGYKAPFNATVIDKLFENNISAFGRTNMDEFAMGSTTESSFYGKTLNPHNHNCTPGGSSGGAAAVVAAGLAVAALGSDTGGSIRQPAAFCGVVGMKPTYGRVSRYGVASYASSFDQVGPITQNVEDAAILYDIINGYDAKDSTSVEMSDSVSDKLDAGVKLKIAVIKDYLQGASKDVVDSYNKTIETLRSAGHIIVEKSLMDPNIYISTYYITASAEASTNLARFDGIRYGFRANEKSLSDIYVQSRSQGFGVEVQRRVMLGNFVLSAGYYDAYYVKAQKVRNIIKQEFDDIFKEADLIMLPVSTDSAPEFGSIKDSLSMYMGDLYTIGANLAGLPAISVPVGKDSKNMPLSIQFLAAAFDEQTLFNGALSLETTLKGSI